MSERSGMLTIVLLLVVFAVAYSSDEPAGTTFSAWSKDIALEEVDHRWARETVELFSVEPVWSAQSRVDYEATNYFSTPYVDSYVRYALWPYAEKNPRGRYISRYEWQKDYNWENLLEDIPRR